MSDTPRTNLEAFFPHESMYQVCDADFCRQLEHELNAATSEIERLTNKVAQLYRGSEELKQRIKRLEQENDAMRADLLLWENGGPLP
jgi:peptidoglycan hydrolase CwlO-like protein